MTEEEAKTKWCPFARTVEKWADGPTLPRNRVFDGEEGKMLAGLVGTHCLGSACMAWRWEQEPNQPELKNWALTDLNDPVPPTTRTSKIVGYCGLAGKP